jgi:hypothetical protein
LHLLGIRLEDRNRKGFSTSWLVSVTTPRLEKKITFAKKMQAKPNKQHKTLPTKTNKTHRKGQEMVSFNC